MIQADVASASPLDLFHPLPIFIRSMVMFFNWLVTTMCYYGLTSAAATLTPDLYLNFTLVILVEVSIVHPTLSPPQDLDPGPLCAPPGARSVGSTPGAWSRPGLTSHFSLTKVTLASQMLAGVTCIAAGLLSGEEQLRWLQVTLALVGKFGATAR